MSMKSDPTSAPSALRLLIIVAVGITPFLAYRMLTSPAPSQSPNAIATGDQRPTANTSSNVPEGNKSTPTNAPSLPIDPSPYNMQIANTCASVSRISGGGYCIDWYYGCLTKAFGDGNFVRLGIPNEYGYYNQMCSLFNSTPSQMVAKRR